MDVRSAHISNLVQKERPRYDSYLWGQSLDGFLTTDDNVRGRLPSLMEVVGFIAVRKTAPFATSLGILTCYTGSKRR